MAEQLLCNVVAWFFSMEGGSEPPKRFCRALRPSEFPFGVANVALGIFILKSQGPADAHEAW